MLAKAKHRFFEQLICDGFDTVFGNPGTFEQGWLDALRDYPQLRYVMGLQESAVVAMATNYARLSRRCGFVQLHAGVGLGNAVGALQEAYRGDVPMLVYAGETSTSLEKFDGYLACDLVALASPTTKWAVRVTDEAELLPTLRRAYALAMTPPRGPVLLALPMDVLDRPLSQTAQPTSLPAPLPAPGETVLNQLADGLRRAQRPVILAGDALAWSGGEAELGALATRLGAPIYGFNMTMLGHLLAHPLFGGCLRYTSGDAVAEVTRRADAVFTIGSTLGTEIFPRPGADYLAPGAALYQLETDARQVGKNVPPALGITADPKATLAALLEKLKDHHAPAINVPPLPVMPPREIPGRLSPERMMAVIAELLPPETIVADESMTSAEYLRLHLRARADVQCLSCLSRGLGSGWPGGISAKLLNPEKPVAAISADGSAMYILPILWTAAHLKLDIVFIACNNRSYEVLKRNISHYWKETGQPVRSFPFMDLDDPALQFDALAQGMGVQGWCAHDEASLRAALTGAFAAKGPQLIDIAVA